MKNLSNILFIRCKFFTCKRPKVNDLLGHVNKIKVLKNQLTYLEVSVKNKDIVIILPKSFPASYEYLITALEKMSMKELTMDYVTPCLIYKMLKCKENPQDENAAMMLQQNKGGNSLMYRSAKLYFYCGKPGTLCVFAT